MAPELIPSILFPDEKTVRERIGSIQELVEWVQLDVLDDTLYANTSWADAKTVDSWNLPCNVELHLMVSDPQSVIEAWQQVTCFRRALWHVEAPINHKALIKTVKQLGRQAGLCLSPNTPLSHLEPYLSLIDRVLVLGVQPGWSGQALIPHTLETVRALVSREPHPTIAFDGGIADDTISLLLEAGAEAICPNSWVFKHPPIPERIEWIRGKLQKS